MEELNSASFFLEAVRTVSTAESRRLSTEVVDSWLPTAMGVSWGTTFFINTLFWPLRPTTTSKLGSRARSFSHKKTLNKMLTQKLRAQKVLLLEAASQ